MKQKAIVLGLSILTFIFGQTGAVRAQDSEASMELIQTNGLQYTQYTKKVSENISDVFWFPEKRQVSISFPDKSIGTDKNQEYYSRLQTFELQSDTLLWEQIFDSRHKVFSQYKGQIYETIANRTNCLDAESGDRKWSKIGNFVGQTQGVGFYFGYKSGRRPRNELTAFDLENGIDLWTNSMKYHDGWEEIQPSGDDGFMVISEGIHKINPTEGIKWTYEASCSTKDAFYAEYLAAGMAFGLVGFFATGGMVIAYPTYTGGTPTISGLHSNIAEIDEHIYFASKNYVFKIDPESGHLFWKEPIYPMGVISEVHDWGDDIVFISKGFGMLYNEQVSYKKPLIRLYSKAEGKERHFQKIKKYGALDDVVVDENGLSIIYPDRVLLFNQENNPTPEVTYTTEEPTTLNDYNDYSNTHISQITHLVDLENDYVKELLPTEYVFENGRGEYFIYNSTERTSEFVDAGILYSLCSTYNGYQFVTNPYLQGYIIDPDLNAVLELSFSPKAKIEDGWLVDHYGQYFQATHIDQIIDQLNSEE